MIMCMCIFCRFAILVDKYMEIFVGKIHQQFLQVRGETTLNFDLWSL